MKRILLLFIASLSILFFGCSKDITKEESLELARPAIDSILKYKKMNGNYPKSLIDIKDFPYKIKKIDDNEYMFIDDIYYNKGYSVYYYPSNNREEKTVLKIDFFENRKVRAIGIYFKKDGSYQILYDAGSLGIHA